MRRGLGLAALALAAVVGLAACGQGAATEPDDAGEISITHAKGTTKVPTGAKRIVSTSVTLTGHLLALGAPVVATQVAKPSKLSDSNGFFTQWADKATAAKVQVLYQSTEVDLEKISSAQPDLIIGAATGQDGAAAEVYDKLTAIAPTVILNYDGLSWQETMRKVAEVLSLQDKADQVVSDYEKHVADLKGKIKAPGTKVTALTFAADGLNVFTPESAQATVATDLGLEYGGVPDNLKPAGQPARNDVTAVTFENASDALGTNALLVVMAGSDADLAPLTKHPVVANLAAVKEKRAYPIGFESFRIDYFSAIATADRIAAAFS